MSDVARVRDRAIYAGRAAKRRRIKPQKKNRKEEEERKRRGSSASEKKNSSSLFWKSTLSFVICFVFHHKETRETGR